MKSVMKSIRNLKNEKEIVSLFKKNLLEKNVHHLAFHPICSNGLNNSILHYGHNNNNILKNNLVLMDVGCKFKHYCSDVTRTFPKSGKFTETQKKIYNIVLECQKTAIRNIKHNANWKTLEKNTLLLMYHLLNKINLVYDANSEKEKINIAKLFMPHGLGHSIGLETHDPEAKDIMNILKKNMVLTVEPGIYFIDHLLRKSKKINQKEVNKYKSIGGIRIEDVVLVNKNNSTVLSKAPKEINELEKLIN